MSVLALGKRVVYGLADPRTGLIMYVGVTNNPSHRLAEHLGRKTRRSHHLAAWIDELRSEKMLPVFIFIDAIKTEDSLQKELDWIKHFQRLTPLLNHKKR